VAEAEAVVAEVAAEAVVAEVAEVAEVAVEVAAEVEVAHRRTACR
jgi:hypothetical protein